jgi:hypothetical protein
MKKTKDLHPVWVEWHSIPVEMKQHLFMKKPLIGTWHYHYENKNGIIGLIQIQVPQFRLHPKPITLEDGIPTKFMWEACGVLDFQRFRTKADAEKEIYKALKEPISNK